MTKNRRKRILRVFSAGQVVYYWRKAKSTSEPGGYRGPARVICQEDNSLVWLTDGRHLIRAAPEQLRCGDELDEEMIEVSEACKQVNISDVLRGVRYGGIEDISKDGDEFEDEENSRDSDYQPEESGGEDDGDGETVEPVVPPRTMKVRFPRAGLPEPRQDAAPLVLLGERQKRYQTFQAAHGAIQNKAPRTSSTESPARGQESSSCRSSLTAPVVDGDKETEREKESVKVENEPSRVAQGPEHRGRGLATATTESMLKMRAQRLPAPPRRSERLRTVSQASWT